MSFQLFIKQQVHIQVGIPILSNHDREVSHVSHCSRTGSSTGTGRRGVFRVEWETWPQAD